MDCTQVLCSPDPDDKLGYKENIKVAILKVNDTEHDIFSGKNRIGRDPEFCRIILDSMALSKEHAIIEAHSHDCHYVYDLGSKNHTKLNKKYLEPHVRYHLTDKALLQFGDMQAEYFIVDGHEKSESSIIVDSDESFIVDTPAPSRSRIVVALPNVSQSIFDAPTQCNCGFEDCKFCFPTAQQTLKAISTNNCNEVAVDSEEKKESETQSSLVPKSLLGSSGQGSEIRGMSIDPSAVVQSGGDMGDDGDVTDPEDIFSNSTEMPAEKPAPLEEQKGAGENKSVRSVNEEFVATDAGDKLELSDVSPAPSSAPSPSVLQEGSVEESVENLHLHLSENDQRNSTLSESVSRNETERDGTTKQDDSSQKTCISLKEETSDKLNDSLGQGHLKDSVGDDEDDETQDFTAEFAQQVEETKTKNGQSVVDSVKKSVVMKSTSGIQSVAMDGDDDDDETDDDLWDAVARKAENLEIHSKTDGKTINKETDVSTNISHENELGIRDKKERKEDEEDISDVPTQIIPVKSKVEETLGTNKKKSSNAEISDVSTHIIAVKEGTEIELKNLEENKKENMATEEIWDAPTQIIPVKSHPKKFIEPNERKDVLNDEKIGEAPTHIKSANSHMGNKKEKDNDERTCDRPRQIISEDTQPESILEAKEKKKNDDEIQKTSPLSVPSSSHGDKSVSLSGNKREEIWDIPTQILPVKNCSGKTLDTKEKDKKNSEEIWEVPTQIIPVNSRRENKLETNSENEKEKEVEDIWDAPTQIISEKTRPGKTLDLLKDSDEKSSKEIWDIPTQIIPTTVGNLLDAKRGNAEKRQDNVSDTSKENAHAKVCLEEKLVSKEENKAFWKMLDHKERENEVDDVSEAPTQIICHKSTDGKPSTNVSDRIQKDDAVDDAIWDAPTQVICTKGAANANSETGEKRASVVKPMCSTPKTEEGKETVVLGNQSSDLEISMDDSPSTAKEYVQAPGIEDVSDESRTPSPSALNLQVDSESLGELVSARRVLRLRLSTIDEVSEKSGRSNQTEGKFSFSDDSVRKSDSGVFNESTPKNANASLKDNDKSVFTEREDEKVIAKEKDIFEAPTQPSPLPERGNNGKVGDVKDESDDEIWEAPTQILPSVKTEKNKLKIVNTFSLNPDTSPERNSELKDQKLKEGSKIFDVTEEFSSAPPQMKSLVNTNPSEKQEVAEQVDINNAETQCSVADRADAPTEKEAGGYESEGSYGSINEAPTQAIDDLENSDVNEKNSVSNVNKSQGISVTVGKPPRSVKSKENKAEVVSSNSSEEIREPGPCGRDRTKMMDAGKMLKSKKSSKERQSRQSSARQQSTKLKSAQELLHAEELTSGKSEDHLTDSNTEATSPVISSRGKSKRNLGNASKRQDFPKKGRKCSDSIISSAGPDQSSQAKEESNELKQSTSSRRRVSRNLETSSKRNSDNAIVQLNTSHDETRPRRNQKLTWKLKENLINDLEEDKLEGENSASSSVKTRERRSPRETSAEASPLAAKKIRVALNATEISTPKPAQKKSEIFDKKQEVVIPKATAAAKSEAVRKRLSKRNESDEDSVIARRGSKSRTERKAEKSSIVGPSIAGSVENSPSEGGKLNRRSRAKKEDVKAVKLEETKSDEKKTERKSLVASKEGKNAIKKVDHAEVVAETSPVVGGRASSRRSRLKSGIKTVEGTIQEKEPLNESVTEPRRPRRRKTEEISEQNDLDEVRAKRQKTTKQNLTAEKAPSPVVKEASRRQTKSQNAPKAAAVSDESSESESRGKGQKKTSAFGSPVSSPLAGRKRKTNTTLESSESESQEGTPKRSSRLTLKQVHSIMFTGVSCSSADEKAVKKLGGKIVEDPAKCTVLVTDKVRRTFKFLCMMAQGKPIVSMDWINNSQSIGQFADPWDFLVKDPEAEKKFKFSLKKSLKLAADKKLLDGYSVSVTPSVKPPPTEMKGIVECCGGAYLPPNRSAAFGEKSFIISCEEDKSAWSKFKKSVPVVSSEVILLGVLQHKINVKANTLK